MVPKANKPLSSRSMDNLKKTVVLENFTGDESNQPASRPDVDFSTPPVKRSETSNYLQVTAVFPDQNQARILLPFDLKKRFFSGEITCFDAMDEWIKISKNDVDQQAILNPIIQLSKSIADLGQIEPATGMFKSGGKFILETGERRFWAIVYNAVVKKLPHESVKILAKSEQSFSIERQIAENEKSESLSAVSKAREIARLVLHYLGVEPEPNRIYEDFEFARQILDKRVSKDIWEKASEHTGLSHSRMTRMTRILKLEDELLFRANAHNLSQNFLEKFILVPKKDQADVLNEHIKKINDSEDDFDSVVEVSQINNKDANNGQEQKVAVDKKTSVLSKQAKKLRFMFMVSYDRLSRDVEFTMDEVAEQLFTELKEDEIKTTVDRIFELAHAMKKRQEK